MSGFFFVAAGGALGAAGRYAVSLLPYTGSFPVLTLHRLHRGGGQEP